MLSSMTENQRFRGNGELLQILCWHEYRDIASDEQLQEGRTLRTNHLPSAFSRISVKRRRIQGLFS
jgi:hypothetical protein